MFTTRHPLPLFDTLSTRNYQLSDDPVYKHKPPRSWPERVQKIQTLLRQQDLVTIADNEILLDTLIATWEDHRSSIKSLANPRKETSMCLKRRTYHIPPPVYAKTRARPLTPISPPLLDEDLIDNLKHLCLQMDDFEMIKPLAKGQFGTVSVPDKPFGSIHMYLTRLSLFLSLCCGVGIYCS